MNVQNDTIVAIITPAGQGAIGTLRISGNKAVDIVNQSFKGKNLNQQSTHTLHFGRLVDDQQQLIDEVVVALFLGEKSYTGEPSVEISAHGSAYILNKILQLFIAHGARLANPGEFTQRAFLNGKMDLTQAEAVADLIAAQSKAAHQTALKQLRGGFSADLKKMREELINFAALIELELDFSDEDVEFADRKALHRLIAALKQQCEELSQSFALGNAIKEGISVAIVGAPNAGKSTLLNALLNEERAIVSDIAGTTRDTIEETLQINGVLFRLIDTAGLRQHTADQIELLGIERSKNKIAEAHLVVYLLDLENASVEDTKLQIEELAVSPNQLIVVGNKLDICSEAKRQAWTDAYPEILAISAREKQDLILLKDKLYEKSSLGEISTENTIITNERHFHALNIVLGILNEIETGLQNQLSSELIAIDIRRALHYLGEITGTIEIDRDILGAIFGKFCIGK